MVPRHGRTLALLTVLVAGTFGALTGVTPPTASAQTVPSEKPGLRNKLIDASGGRGRVAEHPRTGRLRFFGTDQDRPVPRASTVGAGASAEAGARGFLATYGPLFGTDEPGRQLRATATKDADRGRSSVRFQQLDRGVPVIGGELVVNLDRQRNVLSANGELSPDKTVDVKPVIGAGDAAAQAVAAIAKQQSVARGSLRASPPELWLYDPVLLGGPGRPGTRLVWRTEVTSGDEAMMRELVLVDARLGGIALNVDLIDHARTRTVCDRANVVSASETCVAPYTRSEGGPATGVADVDRAYDYSGDVYNFYANNFGRDSLDGAGMPLISTVRYCESGSSCPYPNAFWNGTQMTFGQGFVADDVVAHEFAHGVDQFESNLFPQYQSGAIGESLADVFGELIDLGNGAGNDSPGVRWQLGEDLPGGPTRNLANPPLHGDPDSMSSPNYFIEELDNGGIHTNGGVNNKAAFLMTDGGTFKGITVSGLGTTKVAHVYYEATANLLTSASDYRDLFHALKQACLNKVGTAGITTADCTEVEKAATATEMHQPAPGGGAREAPVCNPGGVASTLFSDDMENTASGNWIFGGTGGGGWSFEYGYATSGNRDMYAPDPSTTSNRTSTRSAAVALPNGQTSFLRFNHAYETEEGYDGGVVEYSTDAGGTWSDAGPYFTDNGYNVTNTDGPLAGRPVFGGQSMGYGSSRLNLTAFSGQSLTFRFRFASDESVGALGWDIDDVRVYSCGPSGSPVITSAASTTFTVGTPGSFTVTATGTPTPSFLVSGPLPVGVQFDTSTGVLSGTPPGGSAGTYNVTFTAFNGVPQDARQSFILTVIGSVPLIDFTPLTPARILDTRSSVGGHPGKLAPGETANVVVTGVGGVPLSGVESVVLNVTATEATTATFLTVFPSGQIRPLASNLNVVPNQDVPNLVVAKVGSDGKVALYNNLGTVNVIFDVVGWYRPEPACFTSLPPARIFDSRQSSKIGPGQTREVQVVGPANSGLPPAGVGAVVVNVTATEATAATFLTVFPTGQQRPIASNLNVVPNRDIPNLVVAKMAPNGTISVYNNLGSTHVIVDVVGWHPTDAACFKSLSPARIFDSRSTAKLAPAQSRDVKVTGVGAVPTNGVAAVVINVTATEATASTFLTVFPSGQLRPNASNVNVVPNQDIPNLVVAKVGANGNVTLYNNAGSTHAIFDVVGYYPAY